MTINAFSIKSSLTCPIIVIVFTVLIGIDWLIETILLMACIETAKKIAHYWYDAERQAKHQQWNQRCFAKHFKYCFIQFPEWSTHLPKPTIAAIKLYKMKIKFILSGIGSSRSVRDHTTKDHLKAKLVVHFSLPKKKLCITWNDP